MMIKINKMKGRKGFTLVELLLVVAILAVLAFLAVPAIAETIRNSRMRTCASNEKMIETGIWRWYSDQIAAGRVLADPTDEGAVVTEGTVADVTALITDADNLANYFTPGGIPTCPFDATVEEPYLISVSVYAGGLLDVLVVCGNAEDTVGAGGGHPRALDPRTLEEAPE